MENSIKQQSDRLLFFGILLFLSGLIAGLFVPIMANPRMGLSGHLEGIMNGMFLVILGLIWHKVVVKSRWLSIAYGLSLFASYANFIAVLIAAVTGAGKMMPIAGGKEGTALNEGIISFLLVTLSLAAIVVCLIVMTGLYRYMHTGRKGD